MKTNEKQKAIKNFQKLPGVGKEITQDLWNLNIKKISDLKNKDPKKLYLELCKIQKTKVGRCMLYVFRCIVSFVNTKDADPKDFKWWNFKDKK